MSTLSSTLSHGATISSSQPQKMRLPKYMDTPSRAVVVDAITRLADRLAKAYSETPKKFYQDRVIAIYMAIYLEVAMGPLLGAVGIYLYTHLKM
jgi:hypothetical protein